MSFCPSKDIHSVYLDGELPENSKFIIANPGGENTITVTTDEFGRHKTIDIDSIQRTDGTKCFLLWHC